VDFIELREQGPVPLRTYERGVEAETLACGTGAAAAALIVHWELQRRSPIELGTRGGAILTVHFREWEGAVEEVFLEGDAREVFAGEIEISLDAPTAAGKGGAASAPAPGREEKGVAAR
jgi:diaminopimelate epimerase